MKKRIFILIILVSCFLRLFQLDTNAPSLTWDEVAWGYNAYSLGIDGKDEFGKFLPLDYIESFGDFKPPVYAYLDILPVKMFGLNEFAVRLPSALFGIATVFTTYFLVRRIFYTSKFKEQYALVTTILLAISPWHILLSRGAFEANVATFFIIFGVYAFLKGVQEKPVYLILSAVSFVLSMHTFNTPRIVTPILIVLLIALFHKKLWTMKKIATMSAVTGLIILLPAVPFLLSPQARLRYQEVNIFSNIKLIETSNQYIKNDNNVWWSKILHNRRVIFTQEYLYHYFDNLSPAFLFIKGDGNPKFSTQTVGQMYLFELPFLLLGTLLLFRMREKNWWLVPVWLLVGIIPAATARETPHALRIETTLPTFQILVAYGMVHIYSLMHRYKIINKYRLKILLMACFIIFAAGNVAYFLEDYFLHYPKTFSKEWQYGYKDAVAYMTEVENKYNKIYLTKELGRPYIYTLFYKKYDPAHFRKEAIVNRDPFGFVKVTSFNKYYFDKNELKKAGEQNILFIDSPSDVPQNAKLMKQFTALDGSVVLVAYTL